MKKRYFTIRVKAKPDHLAYYLYVNENSQAFCGPAHKLNFRHPYHESGFFHPWLVETKEIAERALADAERHKGRSATHDNPDFEEVLQIEWYKKHNPKALDKDYNYHVNPILRIDELEVCSIDIEINPA